MSKDGTTINVEGLDGLIKALKTKAPKARVGIINKNGRNDGETNATIGRLMNLEQVLSLSVLFCVCQLLRVSRKRWRSPSFSTKTRSKRS